MNKSVLKKFLDFSESWSQKKLLKKIFDLRIHVFDNQIVLEKLSFTGSPSEKFELRNIRNRKMFFKKRKGLCWYFEAAVAEISAA